MLKRGGPGKGAAPLSGGPVIRSPLLLRGGEVGGAAAAGDQCGSEEEHQGDAGDQGKGLPCPVRARLPLPAPAVPVMLAVLNPAGVEVP